MPTIKLGPEGQELTLPNPRFRSAPGWPITKERSIEEQQVLDGSYRYNFKEKERRVWQLEWDLLTRDQVSDFDWLASLQTELNFQNTWDDETWHTVVISSYQRQPIWEIPGALLWQVSLTLKEVI